MRLIAEECWSRVAGAEHGVLATVHAERGVDAVPVVFALDGGRIVIPIDTVKPKSTTTLQRATNLAGDTRCALLVEHYDDDWTRLWWVRVHGTASLVEGGSPALTARFPAYRDAGSVVATIVLVPEGVTGWSASG